MKTLRRYQQKTLDNFCDWFGKEDRLATVILPTGTGKSFTASSCIASEFNKKPIKVLWAAHREELIDQAFKELSDCLPHADIQIEMAERKAKPYADIIVGSVQTLARTRKNMEGFVPDLIVIDEYHHYHEKNVQYHGLLERYPKAKILGLTATPYRFVGGDIPLGQKLIEMDIGVAIAHQYLVPPKAEVIKSNVSLAGVKSRAGDFAIDELSNAVNTEHRNKLIADRVEKAIKEEGRKGILFGVDVNHSKTMAKVLRKRGIKVEEVYGETPKDERVEIMRRVRNKEVDILVNNLVCLDSETEILTKSGWCGINDISEFHEVANWEEGKIWFEKPEKIVIRDRRSDERMVSLQTNKRSVRVTEDHELLYRTSSYGSYKKQKAKNICNKILMLPISGILREEIQEGLLDTCLNEGTYFDLLNFNKKQFDALIEEFLTNGTGCIEYGKHLRIYNHNYELLSNVQAIATCHGYKSLIKKYKDNIFCLKLRKSTKDYTCDKNTFQFEEDFKEEKVWCVKTTSGNIITRRNGSVTVMGNCTEGFDVPYFDLVCIARPTKSLGLFYQMLGRGLRLHPGKNDCLVIDIFDKVKVTQGVITFKKAASAGDIDGSRRRAEFIFKEEIANKLTNFPVSMKIGKDDIWTIDNSTWLAPSWNIDDNQYVITWSKRTERVKNKDLEWTKLKYTPKKMDLNKSGLKVKNEKFGIGKANDVIFASPSNFLSVDFNGEIKNISIDNLYVESNTYTIKHLEKPIRRAFYIICNDTKSYCRIIALVQDGKEFTVENDLKGDATSVNEIIRSFAIEDDVLQIVKADAVWRKKPASDKQKNLIKNFIAWGKLDDSIDLTELTGGDASALMDQVDWKPIINSLFCASKKEELIGYLKEFDDI